MCREDQRESGRVSREGGRKQKEEKERRGIIRGACFTLSAVKRAVARHDKREEARSVKVRRGVVSLKGPGRTRRRWPQYHVARDVPHHRHVHLRFPLIHHCHGAPRGFAAINSADPNGETDPHRFRTGCVARFRGRDREDSRRPGQGNMSRRRGTIFPATGKLSRGIGREARNSPRLIRTRQRAVAFD